MNKIKTPIQLKREKIRAKIVDLYVLLSHDSASNFRKAEVIAKKLDLSTGFVARVIKKYNDENNSTNGKPTANS